MGAEKIQEIGMESEKIRDIVQKVVRAYREQQSVARRPFLNEMTCFLVQATFLQCPQLFSGTESEEVVDRCVRFLTLEDCPAIETIQLQVSGHAVMFMESIELINEERQHNESLQSVMQSIADIKVLDKRVVPKMVENLHKVVMEFSMKTCKRMEESLNSGLLSEPEICTALDSVFSRTGFVYWMDLSEFEKFSQLQELSNIIPGICAYNSARGKSNSSCQSPFDIFEKEIQILQKRIKDELKDVNKRADSYKNSIFLHIDSLGTEHVLIQRLRDELIYEQQLSSFFQHLEFVLSEMRLRMSKFSDTFYQHLNNLQTTIGTHKSLPTELVYPEFQVVGHLQRKASEELRYLRAHSKAAATIFVYSCEPNFRRTPVGLASLSADSGLSKLRIIVNNCGCLPAHVYTAHCGHADTWRQPSGRVNENNIDDAMKVTVIKADDVQNALLEALELQLNGYCAISVIRNQGILLQGDPKAGLVRVGEKYFSFSTPHALNEFVKAPISSLRAVEMMATMLPHLVNILGLQHESCLSCLAIPHILELVKKQPLPCEFSTQTAVHIQPHHQFDEETLFNRALQLASKQTHSTQTCSSHFHRDSCAQVWRPKEKSTQSLIAKGTAMPKRVKYLENLCGPPDNKFNVLDITLNI